MHIIIIQFSAQANAHQMGNKIHSMIVLGTRIHTVIYNTTHGRTQPLTFLPMRLSHLNLHILIKSLVKSAYSIQYSHLFTIFLEISTQRALFPMHDRNVKMKRVLLKCCDFILSFIFYC